MRDGLVVVDKAPGWTSHDVVAKLRGVYGQKRVGHAGTLDPDATGVLLVGLGRVTRLLRYLQEAGKEYRGRVVFGVATDTLDASGAVLERAEMTFTRAELERGGARVRRRHRAGAADGVGAEGRRPPALRAGARGRGDRARGPARCTSASSSSRSSSPARTRRPRSGSRARAAPTSARSRPTSAPRSAGARTSDRCAGCASAASRSTRRARSKRSRPIPTRPCVAPTEAMRDLECVARRRASGRARSRTARRSRRPRCSASATAPGPFAVVDEAGALLAVYERRGGGREAGGRRSRPKRRRVRSAVRIYRDPDRGRRRIVGGDAAGRSRSARSTVCTSVIRPCCDSSASSPQARGLVGHRAHLRPASGRGRPPRLRAEAADHARTEARAARGDRRGRRVPRAAVRRGRAARSRPSSSSRSSSRARCAPASSWSAPTSTSATAATATFRSCSSWAPSSASRRSASAWSPRPIATPACPYSSTRIRELIAAGDVEGAARDARPSARGARPGRARRRPRSRARASRPRTSAFPRTSACPLDGVYAGTFTGADGVARPAAISVGRRPDLLRRGRAVPARGVRPRLRRRPLRPAGPGPVHRTGSGARSASTTSTISSPRCTATSSGSASSAE